MRYNYVLLFFQLNSSRCANNFNNLFNPFAVFFFYFAFPSASFFPLLR